jgi:hypothetical protein
LSLNYTHSGLPALLRELVAEAIAQAVDAWFAGDVEMSQIVVKTTLLANSQQNALTGTQYEYLPPGMFPRGAFCEFASIADATGVLRTIQTGSDVVEEESPVNIGTINVQPVYPDSFTCNDLVGPGERINVKLRDTSGAQRIVTTMVKFTAL